MNKGQRAEIYNGWDSDGNPILEGIATLKELRKSDPYDTESEIWMVEFDDEPGEQFQRVVFKQHIIEGE